MFQRCVETTLEKREKQILTQKNLPSATVGVLHQPRGNGHLVRRTVVSSTEAGVVNQYPVPLSPSKSLKIMNWKDKT